jgi:hypothetical protein
MRADMKFNHLVEINDPSNSLLDPLTRDQLWHGLVLRAEAPTLFVPWLDSCKLMQRSSHAVARELRYGTLLVCDNVTFISQQSVHYAVPQQNDIPASTLVMSIEEPQPGVLFVRFEYDDGSGDETSVETFYNDFRRSAYEQSDIDTIRIIRQLARQGRLDTLPT